VIYCKFQALAMPDGVAVVDAAVCMGCGVCASRCDVGAASLVRDPARGEPLETQGLMAEVAGVIRDRI
jgi:Fe-S-cluster-containing hydrogenase component 2